MTVAARRLPSMSPRVALLVAAAIVLGIVLYAGREALGPFIVGLLVVCLLAPPIERLARLGLPRWQRRRLTTWVWGQKTRSPCAGLGCCTILDERGYPSRSGTSLRR